MRQNKRLTPFDTLYQQTFGANLNKKERRRLEIARQAIPLLADGGFDGFTLDFVAERCNLSRPNLIYYFASKKDLVIYAVKLATIEAQTLVVGKIDTEAPKKEILRQIVEGNIEFAFENPMLIRLFLIFYHQATIDADLNALHRSIRDAGTSRFATAIQFYLSPYSVSPTKAKELARVAQSILAGHMLDWVIYPPKMSRSKYSERTVRAVQGSGLANLILFFNLFDF
jgi:AcrR family transcriptional regulator